MKFSPYDKFILEYTQSKINKTYTSYKNTIKNEYINVGKILNEAKVLDTNEVENLIHKGKDFVAGVNIFDSKKTDFYLLSNRGITIPIVPTKSIKTKDGLEDELKQLGFYGAMNFELKSKNDILSLNSIYSKYRIQKDMSTNEIADKLNLFTPLKISVENSSYYKRKRLVEQDIFKILDKSNEYSISLFEKMNEFQIPENEIIDSLKAEGFNIYNEISITVNSLKKVLSFLDKESLNSSYLYDLIENEKMTMNKLDYYDFKGMDRDLISLTFDTQKLKEILKTEEIKNIEHETNIKISSPILNVADYQKFLDIEDFIKKLPQNKDLNLSLENLPTLNEVYEQNGLVI